MAKIGLFYGSTMGNTASVAEMIQREFGSDIADISNVAGASAGDLKGYDILIFGTSTWGLGEHQDDWASFESSLDAMDFTGKKVALFGLGDQLGYPETFVDAMGLLYEKVKAKGAVVVGMWLTDEYEHDSSRAEVNGKFVGLALDEDNQSDMTRERVKAWVEQLRGELAL